MIGREREDGFVRSVIVAFFNIDPGTSFLETAGDVRTLADESHRDGGVECTPSSRKSRAHPLIPILFTRHWTTPSVCLPELSSHLHWAHQSLSANGNVFEYGHDVLFYRSQVRGGSQVFGHRQSFPIVACVLF